MEAEKKRTKNKKRKKAKANEAKEAREAEDADKPAASVKDDSKKDDSKKDGSKKEHHQQQKEKKKGAARSYHHTMIQNPQKKSKQERIKMKTACKKQHLTRLHPHSQHTRRARCAGVRESARVVPACGTLHSTQGKREQGGGEMIAALYFGEAGR